jgi:hypothetical protein
MPSRKLQVLSWTQAQHTSIVKPSLHRHMHTIIKRTQLFRFCFLSRQMTTYGTLTAWSQSLIQSFRLDLLCTELQQMVVNIRIPKQLCTLQHINLFNLSHTEVALFMLKKIYNKMAGPQQISMVLFFKWDFCRSPSLGKCCVKTSVSMTSSGSAVFNGRARFFNKTLYVYFDKDMRSILQWGLVLHSSSTSAPNHSDTYARRPTITLTLV